MFNSQFMFSVSLLLPVIILVVLVLYWLLYPSKSYTVSEIKGLRHGSSDTEPETVNGKENKYSRWKVTYKDGTKSTKVGYLRNIYGKNKDNSAPVHYKEIV